MKFPFSDSHTRSYKVIKFGYYTRPFFYLTIAGVPLFIFLNELVTG
ncbi:MAG TPA: hypothetical protein VIQ23_16575 [Hanamia sp.]